MNQNELTNKEVAAMNEAAIVPSLLHSSVDLLRTDFEKLHRRSQPVRHVLIEAASTERLNRMREHVERCLESQPYGCRSHSSDTPLWGFMYTEEVDQCELNRVCDQGSAFLREIDAQRVIEQFDEIGVKPVCWWSDWVVFVHVLGWHQIPGSLLTAKRKVWIKEHVTCDFDVALAARAGDLGGELPHLDMNGAPDPFDSFSQIDDLTTASIAALSIITECGVDGIRKKQMAGEVNKVTPKVREMNAELQQSGAIPEARLAELFEIKLVTLRGYFSEAGLNTRTAGQRHAIVLDRESLMKLYRFYQREHSKALACQILHAALFSSARRP